MERSGRCAPRRDRAAPAALIALLLFIGLVADGGASTPTRSDLDRPATAAPTQDRSAPRPGRDEHAAWELASTADRTGPAWTVVPIPAALAALVLVLAVTLFSRPSPPPTRRRVDLRRRGPPSFLAL
ncbi:hypothetical protein [Iamia sp.]|uniref:hypothetical protein n=1 Tax=Iamia sp. TaxID=2722710 RepID=UPI002C046B3E|nr:hypothetical protein [Iamia sp.]HXH57711.1 hypothetical protein [Iamia sp.]